MWIHFFLAYFQTSHDKPMSDLLQNHSRSQHGRWIVGSVDVADVGKGRFRISISQGPDRLLQHIEVSPCACTLYIYIYIHKHIYIYNI